MRPFTPKAVAEVERGALSTPWLTLAQVAARWQTSVGYVRAQARSGRLQTTLVGRHHRVHVTWADAALGLETTDIQGEGPP